MQRRRLIYLDGHHLLPAGHGAEQTDHTGTKKHYLIPQEFPDKKRLAKKAVDQHEVLEKLKLKSPLVTLAILDCCRESAEVRAGLKELRPAGTVPVRLVAVSKTKPVAALMAAYRAGQVGATRPRATIARAPSAIASVTLETCRAGVARRSARSARTTSRSSSKRPR